MNSTKKFSGVALATAAAMLFSTATVMTAHAADEAKVKCEGGNSCKGKGACATAKHSCAGLNSCKGQSYVMLPKAECDAAKAVNNKTANK
ncbi:MAG TPA: hypothetical protein VGN07_04705 [Steroidobacteraceae bacterium]|jgi:hypothetical protein